MLDFQVGQPLMVTVTTANGPAIHKGEYAGSDESNLILNENAHTPLEGWVVIPRENIEVIHKITTQALAAGFFPLFSEWR